MSDKETGITRQEFKDWTRSKVTKYVIDNLELMRKDKQDMVLAGATLDPRVGKHATPHALGFIAGISAFLDMKYDDQSKPVSKYEH